MDAYRAHEATLGEMASVARSGQLQVPQGGPGPLTPDSPVMPFLSGSRMMAKIAGGAAEGHAATGETSVAVEQLDKGYAIVEGVASIGASDINYLVAVALRSIMDTSASRIVKSGKLSQGELRQILDAAPSLDDEVAVLERCAISGFQAELLPLLPNLSGIEGSATGAEDTPRLAGQYDAIETAKVLNKLMVTRLENCRRPLSKFDPSGDTLAAAYSQDLPDDSFQLLDDSPEKQARQFWYDVQMNRLPNSLGRVFFIHSFGKSLLQASAKMRTHREALRAFIALNAYELRHKALPAKLDALVSDGLVKRVPWDYMVDKPLRYNASTRKVWSVGRDQIDGGGSFAIDFNQSEPDWGFELTRVGLVTPSP